MTQALKPILFVCLTLLLGARTVPAQSGRQIVSVAEKADEATQSVLRIATTEVQLEVTVRDSLGQAVTGLQCEDFLIYDEGKRYEPAHCVFRHVPSNVILLLDLSSGNVTETQWQALLNFRRALASADRLAVLQYTDELVLTQDWSNDETALRKALRPALRANGKAALNDALTLAAAKLAETDGQGLVLLLTNGLNNAGLADFSQAQLALQSVGATVYVFSQSEALAVALRQPGPAAERRQRPSSEEILLASLAQAEAKLAQLAHLSGGKIFFPVQARSLGRMLLETADDLRGQYWLTYVLEEERGHLAGLQQIEVLTRAGHQTHTRASAQRISWSNRELRYFRN